MSTSAYNSKLAELRVRTDRDLVNVIRRELGRGLALASVATSRKSLMYGKAEKIHKEAGVLLSKIYSLSESERQELEAMQKQLRAELDAAPRGMGAFEQAAC